MPRKPIEIEPGTKFGLLTVLEREEDFRYPNGLKATAYRCLCECGNEKVIAASNLIHGRSKSCGCQIGRTSKRIRDLTGQTFGKLTAIKRGPNKADPSGKQRTRWYCSCSCGNPELVLVQTDSLVQGLTKTCGCSREDNGLARRITNRYEFRDDFVIGYTQKGRPFFISREDFERVKEYCWIESHGYIVARMRDGKNILLHRLIMNAPDGMFVDHINHDCFDNRRCNLRIVDPVRSTWNQRTRNDNECGVRGVYQWDGRWIARISVCKENIDLGHFDTKEEAEAARKEAEVKYYGEYNYDDSIAAIPRIEGIPWREPLVQFPKANEEMHLTDISQKPRANNTSGCTGVYLHKDRGRERWAAKITVNKKAIYLGAYEHFEDAVAARKAAEEKYFGESDSVSSVPVVDVSSVDGGRCNGEGERNSDGKHNGDGVAFCDGIETDTLLDATVAIKGIDPVPEFDVLTADAVPVP